jgi:NAD(P)-dependent dehydrogenase (short-subunit alcohol dehydrogenase family)
LPDEEAQPTDGSTGRQVAVITGSTSGIGARTTDAVRRRRRQGGNCRPTQRGGRLAQKLGDAASFIRADVSIKAEVEGDDPACRKQVRQARLLDEQRGEEFAICPIPDVDLEVFDAVIAVHLRSVLAGMKYAARVMTKQGTGSIITVSSVNGIRAGLGGHYYSAAKAASIHLARCAAMELGEKGIRVNSISPGMIATGAFAKFAGMQSDEADDHPEYAATAIGSVIPRWQPLQRVGRVDDIAQAALFLASDASRFLAGHNLVVDGGISAGWPIAAARPDRESFFSAFQVGRPAPSA